MIKAVIFDVDGVLLDSFEANLQFYQNLMEKTGYPSPTREEFPAVFHLAMWDVIKVLTKLESEEEIKKIWKMGESREMPYPLELLSAPQGIEEVLGQLSRTYKLAVVTSRVRSAVFEAPQLAKLKSYFTISAAYEDTVNHKPHPEPLLKAAQQLGVLSEEVVYIGDVENDMKAARAAGMKFILFSPARNDSSCVSGGAKHVEGADGETSVFTEIPELINKLK